MSRFTTACCSRGKVKQRNWLNQRDCANQLAPESPVSSALCLNEQNACPPEDVGVASDYADLLKALAEPTDSKHEELKEWIRGSVDFAIFDVAEVNERLNRSKT